MLNLNPDAEVIMLENDTVFKLEVDLSEEKNRTKGDRVGKVNKVWQTSFLKEPSFILLTNLKSFLLQNWMGKRNRISRRWVNREEMG